jgi:hypothetical protein
MNRATRCLDNTPKVSVGLAPAHLAYAIDPAPKEKPLLGFLLGSYGRVSRQSF